MARDIPSQQQLLFPLLSVLARAGGALSTADACTALADRAQVSGACRGETVLLNGRNVNTWSRHVRFVRQKAVSLGFISDARRGEWALTPAGRNGLRTATPALVICVYATDRGGALWATAEAAVQTIEDGSVTLHLASPPYPLLGKLKPYQEKQPESEYHTWLLDVARRATRTMDPERGTLIFNLGPVWTPGAPSMSLYRERFYLALQEELGLHLLSDFYWESPSKLPGPAAWTTVNRWRTTPSVEHCYAFGRSPQVQWDNRRVLVPYSDAMRARLAAGGERGATRPSGHVIKRGSFARDCGGSIAHHLVTASHTTSNDGYTRDCKARALPVHPARFPRALVEHFVKLCTAEGDLVVDLFGGSLTTAAVCEDLNRRWLASEQSLTYLAGAGARLRKAPGFTDPLGLLDVRAA